VKVEESKTITGNSIRWSVEWRLPNPWFCHLAAAWIFSDIFDEYVYNPENPSNDDVMQSTQDERTESTSFEMPLNTVIECLNIFGTAASSGGGGSGGKKGWKRQGEDSDNESGDENGIRPRGNRIEPLNPHASEKHTGMRLTYVGAGHPLTLLMFVLASLSIQSR
jgi:cell cycle checkpoint protein